MIYLRIHLLIHISVHEYVLLYGCSFDQEEILCVYVKGESEI